MPSPRPVTEKSGLGELLTQLLGTVDQIAQEVEGVRQENEDVRQENVKLKKTLSSLESQEVEEVRQENVELKGTLAGFKRQEVEEAHQENVTMTILGNSGKSYKPSDKLAALQCSEMPNMSRQVSPASSEFSQDQATPIVQVKATEHRVRTSSHLLTQFDLKRAWKHHPEFFDVAFVPGTSQSRLRPASTLKDIHPLEEHTCLRLFVMDPNSARRGFWSIACFTFLMCDLVFIPVDISFKIEESGFIRIMEIISTIFWTLDIIIHFLTGVITPTHLIERRLVQIAKHYFRTGFFFDFILVTMEYTSLILKSSFAGTSSLLRMARWGRLFRLLRLARLARLAMLRPFLRRFALRFHLSKSYAELSHGWLGLTLFFVIITHLQACLWHYFGQFSDSGWVRFNHLESATVAERYAASIHWAYSRICLTMSGYRIQTTPEFLIDACLMFLSFILASYYFGQVSSVVATKASSHPFSLWKASIEFVTRYHLSKTLARRVERVLEGSLYLGAAEVVAEEEMFLDSLPVTLKKDLIFESRKKLLIKKQIFFDMVSYKKQVVVAICNHTITSQVIVATERLFELGDAGDAMRFITFGRFSYLGIGSYSQSFSVLAEGSSVSEIVLWTETEHRGRLEALQESRILTLDALQFSEVLGQHKEAYMHAVRYAKHFVWRLNQQFQVDDLTEFTGLSLEVINNDLFEGNPMDHFLFISHYKVESGTEATLIRDLMEAALRADQSHPAGKLKAPIFIDSEDLADLATLQEHVRRSNILMVLLTPGIFSRPWCLLEIVTAIKHNTILVPVEVQRPGSPFQYPDEEFYKNLLAGKYLRAESVALLESEGVRLEEVEVGIRHLFRKIALPFSPHKSKVIREAEVFNILKRCDSELSVEEEVQPMTPHEKL